MTDKVKKMLDLLRSGEYKKHRIDNEGYDLTDKIFGVDEMLIPSILLEDMLEREEPIIFEGDIFGFNRRNVCCPSYTNSRGNLIRHCTGNLTPNYAAVMDRGLDDMLREIRERAARTESESDKRLFYEAMERDILSILNICDRYLAEAEKRGTKRLVAALRQVPRKRATSFYEACVFMKIIIYALRCAWHTHIGLGRFDIYMLPYYRRDIERGDSQEELFETLELFFITLNMDSDVYFGLQQGDNGQSMMLGGYDKDGEDTFNELSRLCIEASRELCLIDPKLNVRVNKTTPDERYELCATLTKQGLGFPQYCNDDIVVPYLISMGYDEDDAYNYTVAACWEFISPNNGYDIPNRRTFSYPLTISGAVREHLSGCADFEQLMEKVAKAVKTACDGIIEYCETTPHEVYLGVRAHLLSLFVDGCVEKGMDINQGAAKYNNCGCHGAGLSDAADALYAIKQTVFGRKTLTADELLAALEADFEGYENVRNMLLACPKMGNNDDGVDGIAMRLMDMFVSSISGRRNERGGVWRAGTGSAQDYYIYGKRCPATANGRCSGDAFACSYSPSLLTKLNGPLSVIQSFTKYDLKKYVTAVLLLWSFTIPFSEIRKARKRWRSL